LKDIYAQSGKNKKMGKTNARANAANPRHIPPKIKYLIRGALTLFMRYNTANIRKKVHNVSVNKNPHQ